ncbi:hypothetical protein [Streptosporangium pseudovulgare]|uniref:Chemotaxis protein n=1 Tax=Streptosporangium pseudovulgare TaxID=35765 RepID=A0ABQ2QP49_9ACTN|nr:hypothetical protein [Streptosporangium pseudovulgare]GGP87469.1 hypothetical protein GCM10010140_16020 [Streptosporangium pseudovulgare]
MSPTSRLIEELRDPWGLLLGATAGGAAWAVDVHPAAAAFVGVTVWLVKAGVALAQGRGARPAARVVASGSREAYWLDRAVSAARDFGELSASMGGGPFAGRIALMRPRIDDALATLERLAEQASRTGTALGRFDPVQLSREHDRLTRELGTAKKSVTDDIGRALASLAAQRDVIDRLTETRDQVLARMESSAIGIEGLVARVVELSAMTAAGALEPARVLDELADSLEGVRQGLHETERITRDALDPHDAPDR